MSQQPTVIKLFDVHLEVKAHDGEKVEDANYEVRMSRFGVELFKGANKEDYADIRKEIVDAIGNALDTAVGIKVKGVTVENVLPIMSRSKKK